MKKEEKLLFKRIKKQHVFIEVYDKVIKEQELDLKESSYILSIALLFLDEYKKNDVITYLEFSYYLILKYSIVNNDYEPLYRFAIDNGLYPIIRSLYNNNKIAKDIEIEIVDELVDSFRSEIGVETYQQNKQMNLLLKSRNNFNSFIAPTSYGKSAVVYREIFNNLDKYNKIAIIVPKKTLIWQVYRDLKQQQKTSSHHIIFHDQMYANQNKIIAVMTQERALRLISDNKIYFDKLFIDEAHNLFEKDDRNILLARLIRLNKLLNPNQEIMYLSPLISDSANLKIKDQTIQEFKISFNIKALNINLCNRKFQQYIYDIYLDRYLFLNEHKDYITYIMDTKLNKNLIYLRSPSSVEKLSIEISKALPEKNDKEITQLLELLKLYVDPNFYLIDTLKKGLIYLHGKLPDLIKDFIEYKYLSVKEIKFLCANSVILEGVNFPVDNIYIFDTYTMNKKTMLNLIGRVNRLSYVFGTQFNLNKLLIPVHFVDTFEFNKTRKMENYIKKFRNELEKDHVVNPILDLSQNKDDLNTISNEERYLQTFKNEDESIYKILISNGINLLYSNFNLAAEKIYHNVLYYKSSKLYFEYFEHEDIDIIDLIWEIFFKNFVYFEIKEKEVARLLNKKAREFYNLYIHKAYHFELKAKIGFFMNHFSRVIELNRDTLFYVGQGYGDTIRKNIDFSEKYKKVFIDLKRKSRKELVNIAIVKSKIEDDFVSFYIDKFVRSLCDLDVIDESQYEKFRYGTDDKSLIDLYTYGLSPKIINLLKAEKLISEIIIDKNGEVKYSKDLKKFIQAQDELVKFEFERIATIQ